MIALEQARQHMETLGLTQVAAVLDSRLEPSGHPVSSQPHSLQSWLPMNQFDALDTQLAGRQYCG